MAYSTYYLNGTSLATATAVFTDSGLTTLATDGWYSDGSISRRLNNGVLESANVCGECVPDLSTPTALGAVATNITVDLTWTDVNTQEDGFEIHRSTVDGFTPSPVTLLGFNIANDVTYSYDGDVLTTYYHKVRAFSSAGTVSDFSNQASATTGCRDWSGNLVTTRTLTPFTQPSDGKWNDDGTKFYTAGILVSNRLLSEYACSSAYSAANIALTATATQNLFTITGNQNSSGISWNNDGTKLAVSSSTDDRVSVLTFTVGFDVSSYSSVINQTLLNPSGGNGWSAVHMHPSGTSLFLLGNEDGFLRKYTMTTPYDPSSGLTLSQTLDISDYISDGRGIDMNSNGTAFLINGIGGNVARFSMSAYDLSTASFVTCYDTTTARGVAINGDNFNKMYLTYDNGAADQVTEYNF